MFKHISIQAAVGRRAWPLFLAVAALLALLAACGGDEPPVLVIASPSGIVGVA